ncbi:hypothetical protein XM38_041250 [Halomicronema hongdechloris C2206]|uniref:Uncharacterized protein n=1 Tax=Halomicronema hongdechloris C2206 TaxID=1641165 RepID=A0A1Z3HS77_9CYAN|nr:hypothetical protein [Halomicronema hongdechloris]ASC73163.1 hypothetical protein XM38_041250 [Halomicronema hongdechloris C2206]
MMLTPMIRLGSVFCSAVVLAMAAPSLRRNPKRLQSQPRRGNR